MNADDPRRPAVTGDRGERVHVCDRCGERMIETHCKLVCPNCGMTRDCSDP